MTATATPLKLTKMARAELKLVSVDGLARACRSFHRARGRLPHGVHDVEIVPLNPRLRPMGLATLTGPASWARSRLRTARVVAHN